MELKTLQGWKPRNLPDLDVGFSPIRQDKNIVFNFYFRGKLQEGAAGKVEVRFLPSQHRGGGVLLNPAKRGIVSGIF